MSLTTTEVPVNGNETKTERRFPFKTIIVEGNDGIGKAMFVDALAIAIGAIYFERGDTLPAPYFLSPDILKSELPEWEDLSIMWKEAKTTGDKGQMAQIWPRILHEMYLRTAEARGHGEIVIVMKSGIFSLSLFEPSTSDHDFIKSNMPELDELLSPDLIIMLTLDHNYNFFRILNRGEMSPYDPRSIPQVARREERLRDEILRYSSDKPVIRGEFDLTPFDKPDYKPQEDEDRRQYWDIIYEMAEKVKELLLGLEKGYYDTQ